MEKFLELYPWREEETGGRRPMDFLWKFSLNAEVDSLWPYLIDTSTFNKLLGLPQMDFAEQGGKLFGSSTNAGILSRWEEVPWEWEYHKGLNNARIYSRGFATYVRSRYLLAARADGGTDFHVYFGWIPRKLIYRLLLKVGMGRLKNDYSAALAKITRIISERRDVEARQRAIYAATAARAIAPSGVALMADLSARAVRDGADAQVLEKISDYVMSASDDELSRIKLRILGRSTGIPLAALAHAALYATRAGMLSLSWDVTCPHCRGVRKSAGSLGEVTREERCDACDITFSTEEIGNMEVIFHVNPEIRAVEKKFYCAAEPATKKHIYIQRRVPARTTLEIVTDLEPGEYRARVLGNKKYLPVLVGEGEEKRAVIRKHHGPLKVAAQPDIIFLNSHDSDETLIVERRDEDNDALRPAEIFGMQLFRDLFGNQSLAEGLKIELGTQNILFTDIVGSTDLYLKNGDSEAFGQVRKHFQKTYDIVRAYGGAVVKTIGDSAMVAFADALQCIRAAAEIQRAFDGGDETGRVFLRISIHSGPCLAVNLNSGIDYFGNTVNYAAKLQQMAGAKEIALSPEFYADGRVRAYLDQEKIGRKEMPFAPKWAEKPFAVSVVRIE